MKVLLQTRFPPSVGGIETLAVGLAREWRALGVEVAVSTDVGASAAGNSFPYPVQHQPDRKTLLSLWRSHDVVVQMNVSLKTSWPMLLLRKPVVFVHHTPYWIDREGTRDWRERLKLTIARRSPWNICVSVFVREATGLKNARIIPNSYDRRIFNMEHTPQRDKEIVFVGRLVSDKGADLLLEAVSRIPGAGNWTITIIGDGPERAALEQQARQTGLANVRFTGSLPPQSVADKLRRHQVLVVPSLWREPFGIVALEGMACGCSVLASDGGGLPEAVGNAGLLFRRGDASDLSQKLSRLIENPNERAKLTEQASAHLAGHTEEAMAKAYLEVIQAAVAQHRSRAC
ncbi:MAG TPA: glycosyltransferase family 4 protein [Verrucomicrobiota bacterium]|nr:glycosyltransferase family 4 protein [Verrucomicrobiota bacterium]